MSEVDVVGAFCCVPPLALDLLSYVAGSSEVPW